MKDAISAAVLIFAFTFGTGLTSVYATVVIVFAADSYDLSWFAQVVLAISIPIIVIVLPVIALSLLKSRKWLRDYTFVIPTLVIASPIMLSLLVPKIWHRDNKTSGNLLRWFRNDKARQTSQA